ncbi:MAG: hypothetical protein A2Y33_03490 [Spirochaetes bacterium GWF1_51_8]|nr:MAG: hypothetical protein A2Y33_03490 [Spirochaetes bacterium GWF1_51_8]
MKYLGEKSVSSFFSKLLAVLWYVVLVFSIIGFFILIILIVITSIELPVFAEAAAKLKDPDWDKFKNIPLFFKILIAPYCAVLVVFVLRIMKSAQAIFSNFAKNIVFDKNNVEKIAKTGKMMIVLSIMTFNLSTFLVSVILLIVCEIFKNGTALQEEHDLTV